MLFRLAAFGFNSSFSCFFLLPRVRMAGKRTRSATAMQRRTARRVSVSLETIILEAASLPDPRGYAVAMPCTQPQVLGTNGLVLQMGLPKRLPCGCAGWFLTRLRVGGAATCRRARLTEGLVARIAGLSRDCLECGMFVGSSGISDHRVIGSSGYRIIGLSDHWVVGSLGCRVIGFDVTIHSPDRPETREVNDL